MQNKEQILPRQAKVLEQKLEGKTVREIGKENGTSKSTAHKDWVDVKQRLGQGGTIEQIVDELVNQSLENAHNASKVEKQYIKQVKDTEKKNPQEAQVVSQIGERGQKRYSFLKGDNSNKDGSETQYMPSEMLDKYKPK